MQVVLDDDELFRVTTQFPSAIPSPDGVTGFDYMAFVKQMNELSQVCKNQNGRVFLGGGYKRVRCLQKDKC